MTLPIPPARQRSWLTRGFYRPSPRHVSVPDILLNTAITLSRDNRVADGAGGFAGQGFQPYVSPALDASGNPLPNAYVEILTDDKTLIHGAVVEAVGVLQMRHYLIVMRFPATAELVPLKSDRLDMTDPAGRSVRILIDKVEVPLGIADHIEFTTELFE